jgi:hypothetical protein
MGGSHAAVAADTGTTIATVLSVNYRDDTGGADAATPIFATTASVAKESPQCQWSRRTT